MLRLDMNRLFALLTTTIVTWLWTALLLRTITAITWHGTQHVFKDVSSISKYVTLFSLLEVVHTMSASAPVPRLTKSPTIRENIYDLQ